MEEPSIQEQLDAQQKALAEIYKSVEKTRKYILWTVIGTVVTFILPLIGIAIILPRLINTLTQGYSGLL